MKITIDIDHPEMSAILKCFIKHDNESPLHSDILFKILTAYNEAESQKKGKR